MEIKIDGATWTGRDFRRLFTRIWQGYNDHKLSWMYTSNRVYQSHAGALSVKLWWHDERCENKTVDVNTNDIYIYQSRWMYRGIMPKWPYLPILLNQVFFFPTRVLSWWISCPPLTAWKFQGSGFPKFSMQVFWALINIVNVISNLSRLNPSWNICSIISWTDPRHCFNQQKCSS